MRYVIAKAEEEVEAVTYRSYVSSGIKILTSNTMNFCGGAELAIGYDELLKKSKEPPDTRTAEEIKAHMKAKLAAIAGEQDGSDSI